MLQILFFIFIGLATLLASNNWRQGLLLMLVAGALQDPVRKMMPGAPGWMVLAFTPIVFAIFLNVFSGPLKPWLRFRMAYPKSGKSILVFLACLFLAGLVLITNYGFGAIVVALIGLLGYAFPLVAILVGFMYVRSSPDLIRFIRFYCALTGLMLVGGVLEYWNVFPNAAAIGTEVLDTKWIRHVPGYIVNLTSGFYRSPDLLGWHAGLLVMLSMLMTMHEKTPAARAFWALMVTWGAVILLISGRNKMIFMPPIFISTVILCYLYKGNVGRLSTAAATLVASIGLFFLLNQQVKIESEYFDYLDVGAATVTDRVALGGVGAVVTTYHQSGFFGEGLGVASTGARFGGAIGARVWQETGPSKILVELGVLGFLAAILLAFEFTRSIWRGLQKLPSVSREGQLYIGLLGIMAANAASFVVSHQAYGDPFLVTLAGFLLGITLSAPRWAFITSRPR